MPFTVTLVAEDVSGLKLREIEKIFNQTRRLYYGGRRVIKISAVVEYPMGDPAGVMDESE